MKKVTIYIFLSALLCIIVITRSNAQTNTRFSKIIRYQPDSAQTSGIIDALAYDSLNNDIYFCLRSARFPPAHTTPSFIRTISVLYKMDANGNILKMRVDSISSANVSYDAVCLSDDKQYLYWGGWVYDTASNPALSTITMDYMVTKTDRNLNRIWRRRYINSGIRYAMVNSIIKAKDGNLMLLGTGSTDNNDSVYPPSPPKNYMLKIDSNGILLWKRTPGQGYYDNNEAMVQSDDSNYLIVGRTFSWGNTNGAPYVLKADTAGAELWHQTAYAANNYTTWLMDICRTKEQQESYVIVGVTVPVHNGNPYGDALGYINKIDENGNVVWEKQFGIGTVSNELWGVDNAEDGDYICAGFSRYTNSQPYEGWLARLDKYGNIKWSRKVTNDTSIHEDGYLYNVVALKDGGFIAVGSADGYDSLGRLTQGGWVIKADSNGCISDNCSNLGIEPVAVQSGAAVRVYPNPTKGTIYLESEKPFPKGASVTLFDNTGRKIRSLPVPSGEKSIRYNLKGLSEGVYFLKIDLGKQEVMKKIDFVK